MDFGIDMLSYARDHPQSQLGIHVVIPMLTRQYAMLQRNLVYTGVTRGKRLVVLVYKEPSPWRSETSRGGGIRSRLGEWLVPVHRLRRLGMAAEPWWQPSFCGSRSGAAVARWGRAEVALSLSMRLAVRQEPRAGPRSEIANNLKCHETAGCAQHVHPAAAGHRRAWLVRQATCHASWIP